MRKFEQIKLIGSVYGYKKIPLHLAAHLAAKFFGTPKFRRPASTLDMRANGLNFSNNPEIFISNLLPKHELEDIRSLISVAELELNNSEDSNAREFPINWNSGYGLQVILFVIIRLTKPSLYIETGTANGASARSVCRAMGINGFGKCISIDIKESSATLVKNEDRKFLECVRTDGTTKNFLEIVENGKRLKPGFSIFMHDSDHSFFNQMSEYLAARNLKFDLLISDDIDASLAFSDFAAGNGIALFDERKIIGGVILNESN